METFILERLSSQKSELSLKKRPISREQLGSALSCWDQFTLCLLQTGRLLIMADSCRTTDEARAAFQSCKSLDPKDRVQFYNSWAANYEKDHSLMSYMAPDLAVSFLRQNFCGQSKEALVLDVACGSGWVARVMAEDGFRHFVGVDGSQAMLDLAAKTGLYQDLKLAILGPEPLPVETGVFDVVIIVGALDAGFIPVSVVRELCHASKPGGFVCMARGDHVGEAARKYQEDLERELQLMEEEGLWSLVSTRQEPRYMENPHGNPEEQPEKRFISGKLYLYRRSLEAAAAH